MKRLLLMIALVTAAVLPSVAQNANRKGFFVEAGAGFLTGKTPRVSLTMDANRDVYANFAHGMAVDLYLGMRFRIHSHWAYEFRLGATAPLDAFTTLPIPKVFPVGFRYTSGELFGNMSLYAHIGFGAVITSSGLCDLPSNPGQTVNVTWAYEPGHNSVIGGVAYSIGAGLNITNHLYAGLIWEQQCTFDCYRTAIKKENLLWGSPGLRIGYRF